MKLAIFAALFGVAIASGASISGRIVDDATGAPVPQSQVRIFGPELSSLLIEAGDDGSFHTADLAAGDYTMTAWHAGYLFTEVTQGHPAVIGLVRLGAIEGRLTGLAGRPAKVLAMMKSGDIWKPVLDEIGRGVTADAEGNFRIPDLPPGQYALLVSYGQSGVLRFDLDGKMKAQIPIPPNGNRFIEGQVELTHPRNWLRVTLSDPVHPELTVATAVIDETGYFSFHDVVPGAYELLAASDDRGRDDFARAPVDVTRGDARGIKIAMQPATQVSIAWHGTCALKSMTLTPLEDWGVGMERTQSRTGVVAVGDPMLLASPQHLGGLAPARYGVSVESGECVVAGNPVVDLTTPQSGDIELTLVKRGIVRGIPDDFTMGEPSLRTMWFSEPAPAMRSFMRRLLGWDLASPFVPHIQMAVAGGG